MNLLRLILGLGEDFWRVGADITEAWIEGVGQTVRDFRRAVALPFLIFVIAWLVGAYGDPVFAEKIAYNMMGIACLLGGILFVVVVFKASVLTEIFALFTGLASFVVGGKLPKVDQSRATKLMKMYMVVLAWVFSTCAAALFIPMWRSFRWTLVILVFTLIIAFMAATLGIRSKAPRYIVIVLAFMVLVVAAMQFNPSMSHYFQANTDYLFAKAEAAAQEKDCEAGSIEGGDCIKQKAKTQAAAIVAPNESQKLADIQKKLDTLSQELAKKQAIPASSASGDYSGDDLNDLDRCAEEHPSFSCVNVLTERGNDPTGCVEGPCRAPGQRAKICCPPIGAATGTAATASNVPSQSAAAPKPGSYCDLHDCN